MKSKGPMMTSARDSIVLRVLLVLFTIAVILAAATLLARL